MGSLRAIRASIDLPINGTLQEEAFQMYQSLPTPEAGKRVKRLGVLDASNSMEVQRNWDTIIVDVQN